MSPINPPALRAFPELWVIVGVGVDMRVYGVGYGHGCGVDACTGARA